MFVDCSLISIFVTLLAESGGVAQSLLKTNDVGIFNESLVAVDLVLRLWFVEDLRCIRGQFALLRHT